MKRTLVATMVLGLLAAAAPAVIVHTVTPMGSFTVGIGSAPIVDVYKITFTVVDPNQDDPSVGSLVLEIGQNAGDPSYAQGIPAPDPNLVFNNPFQGAFRTGGKVAVTNLTPTRNDANTWLMPPDASKLYECDSSFLPSGILTWAPAVVNPLEVNDGSVYTPPGVDDYVAGVGNLRLAVAVPNEWRGVYGATIDAAMVGVIRGTTVWCYTGSADSLGATTKERFLVGGIIPEPATLSVLAMGVLGLLGRRRRT
jgi:hypothetical protein